MASVEFQKSDTEIRFSVQECNKCLENPGYADNYPVFHIRVKFDSIQGQLQKTIVLKGKASFHEKICHCQTNFDSLSERVGIYVERLLSQKNGNIQIISDFLINTPLESKDKREKLRFEPFLSYSCNSNGS